MATYQDFQRSERQRIRRRAYALWLVFILAVATFFLMGCTTEPARQFARDLGDSGTCLERFGARLGYCAER